MIAYYFIDIHRNSLVDYLLDGSAIKEALEHGKEIDNKPCEELYVSCPLDSASATNILMKLLPKKSKIGKSKASSANAWVEFIEHTLNENHLHNLIWLGKKEVHLLETQTL